MFIDADILGVSLTCNAINGYYPYKDKIYMFIDGDIRGVFLTCSAINGYSYKDKMFLAHSMFTGMFLYKDDKQDNLIFICHICELFRLHHSGNLYYDLHVETVIHV